MKIEGTGYLSDFPARLDDMGGAMSIPTHGPLLRTRHSRSLIQYQGSLDPPVLFIFSSAALTSFMVDIAVLLLPFSTSQIPQFEKERWSILHRDLDS